MWLLIGLANPFDYPVESVLTLLGSVFLAVSGWMMKQFYDWWQKSRIDRINNQALENENEQRRRLAQLTIQEKEIELRLKEERGEFDLEALQDNKIIESYKYLLEKERMEKDALRAQHREEIQSMVVEMRSMREEHKKEIAICRADHEQCLQDRAAGLVRIEALEQKVETLSERYENLKRRVGGSDVVIPISPSDSTERMPDKHDKKRGKP